MITYRKNVWGKGHTHERVISAQAQEVVFERWELFMARRYNDGIWDRDYFPPGGDLVEPARRAGDVRWSIGFGHAEGGDNPPFVIPEDMVLTLGEAKDILAADIAPKMRWVNTRFPEDQIQLTPYMFAALTSLAFQFGQGRLDLANKGLRPKPKFPGETEPLLVEGEHRTFPFIDQLRNGDYVDAFITILDLNFRQNGTPSKGLILRRASEVGYAMTRKGE